LVDFGSPELLVALLSVIHGRRVNLSIEGLDIGTCLVNIRSGVGIIVGFDVWREICPDIEIWLADFRRVLCEVVDGGRTTEKSSNDCIPDQ